ncbi:MAG: ion transporter [Candidatus Ornithomonoglobus sp.]
MRKRLFEIIDVSDTDDRASALYDSVMIVLICVSIIPLFFKSSNRLFTAIDRVTAAAFIIDYIFRLATADYKYGKHSIKSFIKYPLSPFAIIDVLSILPVLLPVNAGLKLFRLLRLGKAFRTLKFLRYSKSFNIIVNVMREQKGSLEAVCYLAFGYVLLSALIMYSVEPESFDNFFYAVYWAVVTLTTVGYGDIYPVSVIGRIVSMISSFMGIAIVALPTGIITAGFMSELERKQSDDESEK